MTNSKENGGEQENKVRKKDWELGERRGDEVEAAAARGCRCPGIKRRREVRGGEAVVSLQGQGAWARRAGEAAR